MIQSYTCYITHLLLVKESFSSILYNSLQDQSTTAHYKCSRIFSNNCEEMTHKSPKSKLPNSKNGCHVIPEEEVHKVVMLHLAWSAVKAFVNVIMRNKLQHGFANHIQMVLATLCVSYLVHNRSVISVGGYVVWQNKKKNKFATNFQIHCCIFCTTSWPWCWFVASSSVGLPLPTYRYTHSLWRCIVR